VGIGTFGPMLNKKGNSVGGEAILQTLSEELHLHTFAGGTSLLSEKTE